MIAADEEENFNQIVDHAVALFSEFDAYQKTVFITVWKMFDSAFMGLLLATNKIIPHEFAFTYLTYECINSKVFSGIDRDEEKEMLRDVTKDAECMTRYLLKFNSRGNKIAQLIQDGENIRVEFKSTLRTNLHTNRLDSKMENAVLKTIVAFLNTDGGTLLVGVGDNGEAIGIEIDGFANEDKYLLHFSNLVNDKIGKQFCEHIRWNLYPWKSGKVLCVECTSSKAPVFLRSGKEEQFFIRTGPASVELSASQVLQYAAGHFSKRSPAGTIG